MLYIQSIAEVYTQHTGNDAEPWSGRCCHTSGMLPLERGATSLDAINRKLSSVGLPPINADTMASGTWEASDDDDALALRLSYVGTSDGTPDDDGDFLYDCMVYLTVHTERPATLADLIP